MRLIEGQGDAALGAGMAFGERAPAAELADLARKMAGQLGHDGNDAVEAVVPRDIDRTFQHQPGRIAFEADGEDRLSWRKIPCRAARKAAPGRGLRRAEQPEQIIPAGIEKRQWLP